MSETRGYRELDVYQNARALLKPVHALVLTFPDYEKFDLCSQIRRACKSVPANIAEGYAKRRSTKEFCAYLANAMASANELEVHFEIAHDLGYINEDERRHFTEAYSVIGKQLYRLIEYWRTADRPVTAMRLATRD